MPDDLHDFEKTSFTFEGRTRDLYRRGTGPAVIVMAEIPGITPKVADFARRVADSGFSAVMPHLFGTPGADLSVKNVAVAWKACISKEFAAFARAKRAPVTDWLRALARAEHERCGGPGVGTVGMCFTGNFALAMAVDPSVLAPVMSQPSLPIGLTTKIKRDLHLSPGDLQVIKDRVVDEDLCVIGMRFTGDKLVPGERFERLREEFGDHFVAVDIDSSKGNPWGHPRIAHSVLTEHLVDEPGQPTHDALELVLQLFRDRLLTADSEADRVG